MIGCWLNFEEFDFKIVYEEGKLNRNADTLIRISSNPVNLANGKQNLQNQSALKQYQNNLNNKSIENDPDYNILKKEGKFM